MTSFMYCNRTLFVVGRNLIAFFQSTNYAVNGINKVLTLNLCFIVSGSNKSSFVTYIGNVGTREPWCLTSKQININAIIDFNVAKVHIENCYTVIEVGEFNIYLTVKTACTHKCFVKNVGTVSCCKNNYTAISAKTIHFGEELVQRVFTLVVTSHTWAFATSSSHSINLINKDNTRRFLFCLTE